jgi:hypothetical protein
MHGCPQVVPLRILSFYGRISTLSFELNLWVDPSARERHPSPQKKRVRARELIANNREP